MRENSTLLKHVCILIMMSGPAFTGKIPAQPYQTGYTTLRFTDETRGNKRIPVMVYYPSGTSGREVPIADTPDGKFPVICFGHGYRLPASVYENIRNALVPEGFIVAFPCTEKGVFPSHSGFGMDLSFVVRQLKKEGKCGNSLFFGKISEKSCYMGHSMGGGAAVLGAAYGSPPDALVLLAPMETRHSAVQAAENLTVPLLVFAGGNDCITPPEKNQKPVFDAFQSRDKTYISITGGSHCQMGGDHYLCRLAESTCRPKPSISREEQHAIISRYLVYWLKSRLKGEYSEGIKMEESLRNDPSVTWYRPERK